MNEPRHAVIADIARSVRPGTLGNNSVKGSSPERHPHGRAAPRWTRSPPFTDRRARHSVPPRCRSRHRPPERSGTAVSDRARFDTCPIGEVSSENFTVTRSVWPHAVSTEPLLSPVPSGTFPDTVRIRTLRTVTATSPPGPEVSPVHTRALLAGALTAVLAMALTAPWTRTACGTRPSFSRRLPSA